MLVPSLTALVVKEFFGHADLVATMITHTRSSFVVVAYVVRWVRLLLDHIPELTPKWVERVQSFAGDCLWPIAESRYPSLVYMQVVCLSRPASALPNARPALFWPDHLYTL